MKTTTAQIPRRCSVDNRRPQITWSERRFLWCLCSSQNTFIVQVPGWLLCITSKQFFWCWGASGLIPTLNLHNRVISHRVRQVPIESVSSPTWLKIPSANTRTFGFGQPLSLSYPFSERLWSEQQRLSIHNHTCIAQVDRRQLHTKQHNEALRNLIYRNKSILVQTKHRIRAFLILKNSRLLPSNLKNLTIHFKDKSADAIF